MEPTAAGATGKNRCRCGDCDSCSETEKNREEMKKFLCSVDINKFEPEVVDSLIKFFELHVDLVLKEAKWLSGNANRPRIDSEAIELAGHFIEKHYYKPQPKPDGDSGSFGESSSTPLDVRLSDILGQPEMPTEKEF